jgi:hypothetical protein
MDGTSAFDGVTAMELGTASMRAEVPASAAQVVSSEENRRGSEGVDRIREILFGSQMREQQQQFARVEQRIVQETAGLREEFRRRFEALEKHIKSEFESVAERLSVERVERCERADAIAREVAELAGSLSRRLHQLDEQMARSHRELRQQLLDETANLGVETQRRAEESRSMLENQESKLRADLIDRAALSDLLAEVSLRLKGEFQLPAEVVGDDAARGE